MDRQTRIKQIIEAVKTSQGVSVRELSETTGVTEMTIRRDIAQLSQEHIIKLVSGAVVPDVGLNIFMDSGHYELDVQQEMRTLEKSRIGRLAASLINPGDVVYIDIGTTTSAMIQYIPDDMPVTVVCCTMNALLESRKKSGIHIILAGGALRSDLQMFESKEGEELLYRTRITKAFISAAGINARLGVTCMRDCEVGIKVAALHGALEKVLVADSSKFELVKPAFFADLDCFDAIVTDDGIPDEWKSLLDRRKIETYIA